MPGLTEALFIPYRPVCNTHAYCVEMLNTSIQVRGTCSCFLTKPTCKVRSFHHLAQHPSWRTTPCRLSATVYSIYIRIYPPYWKLSLHLQTEDASGQEPTNHHLEDNIKMDLQKVAYQSMDWIDVAQDRNRWRALVKAAMNLRVPLHAGNFLTSLEPISYSRRTLLHGVSE